MANILVVEDDRYINDVVVRDLKLVGHSCTPVYNGTDAVKTASDNSYDLILLDVLLPGMDGFEVIKHIPRKRQIVPDIDFENSKKSIFKKPKNPYTRY